VIGINRNSWRIGGLYVGWNGFARKIERMTWIEALVNVFPLFCLVYESLHPFKRSDKRLTA
jgi:hypothetical protein